jgi:hypothetical protein
MNNLKGGLVFQFWQLPDFGNSGDLLLIRVHQR